MTFDLLNAHICFLKSLDFKFLLLNIFFLVVKRYQTTHANRNLNVSIICLCQLAVRCLDSGTNDTFCQLKSKLKA